ncbi:MAG: HPr family phosphocarrier protein [Planctomycetes bacterium]|nr:HPr family phosphocarrier protein [Planctomycetota bacterium]
MPKVSRSTTLVNEHGLHARPISKLIEVARRHQAVLLMRCAGKCANGRRMLEMLTLAAPVGSVIEFEADGDDAEQLVDALVALVEAKFIDG